VESNEKYEEIVFQSVTASLNEFMSASARTIQSDEGILGPSDIGFCRQKAALMIQGVPKTDDPPKWAAAVGTSIHNYLEEAFKKANPDWILGSIDQLEVTATLPSGAAIGGHPDIVIPSLNMILDIKTVNGFEFVKREGTSLQHKYQRHLYAMGCLQAGILASDVPVWVGNLYYDRSGKHPEPIVLIEEMDPTLTDEIDSWIQDVIYAVKHNEDASRDVPVSVCEKICSHFTACRGGMTVNDGGEQITDQSLISAIDMYVEAKSLSSQAAKMKDEAKARLYGINGSTDRWQVRWVEVQPGRIEASERSGYMRMDIVKVRK
jgi:hypothetical protein